MNTTYLGRPRSPTSPAGVHNIMSPLCSLRASYRHHHGPPLVNKTLETTFVPSQKKSKDPRNFIDKSHLPSQKRTKKDQSLLLKKLGQLGSDGVTDLRGRVGAANVGGADVLVDDGLDGRVDHLGQLGQAQRVLEHHADGEDGGDGVDDALAGNVGGRAYDMSVVSLCGDCCGIPYRGWARRCR